MIIRHIEPPPGKAAMVSENRDSGYDSTHVI
jgi:hypothetical protein